MQPMRLFRAVDWVAEWQNSVRGNSDPRTEAEVDVISQHWLEGPSRAGRVGFRQSLLCSIHGVV